MIKKLKILILLLLFASQGIFAQTVEIDTKSNQVAGPVTLGLSLNNFIGTSGNISAATFLIKLNPDLLMFNGISNQQYPGNITANFNTSNNILTINYNYPTGQNINGKLLDMDFTYLGGAVAHLIFETTQCEIKNSSQQTISASYTDGYVNPLSTDQMVVLDQKWAQYPGPVTVGLSMLKFEGLAYGPVGAITLHIKYNTSLLTFNSFTNLHPGASGITVNFDNNDKTLKINYSSTTGFGIDGKLLDLNFTYLGGSPVNLIFNTGECEIAKAGNLGVIPATFTDGVVSADNTGIVGELSVPSVDALLNSTISLPVVIKSNYPNRLNSVNSVTLRIGYDHTKLQYTGVTNNTLFVESGNVPGIISLNWSGTASQNMVGPLTLLNLNFRVIGAGDSEVKFLPGTVVTTNTVPEYIRFNNGQIFGANARVRVFLEGFYTGSETMRKAQKLVGAALADNFEGTVADEITIELHTPGSYGVNPIVIPNVRLHQDGYAFFNASLPGPTYNYYITVKHRNHLETVSRIAASFDKIPLTWDFTVAHVNATDYKGSYGNNQKAMSGGKFAIFAGDVNQDGSINVIDRTLVQTAVLNISTGYLNTDVTGDGLVNLQDRSLVQTNVLNIIARIIP